MVLFYTVINIINEYKSRLIIARPLQAGLPSYQNSRSAEEDQRP